MGSSEQNDGAGRGGASPLFQNQASRSNAILARTLFRELVQSGRSRAEILDLVNQLLGLVAERPTHNTRRIQPNLIDPKTGYPTKRALFELLRHELDAATSHPFQALLVLLRLGKNHTERDAMSRFAKELRVTDVLVPLGEHTIALLLYFGEPGAAELIERRCRSIAEQVEGTVVTELLVPGRPARAVWAKVLRQMRPLT